MDTFERILAAAKAFGEDCDFFDFKLEKKDDTSAILSFEDGENETSTINITNITDRTIEVEGVIVDISGDLSDVGQRILEV